MTKLEKIQKEIDKCNNNCGCNSCCSFKYQQKCKKIKKHSERIEECIKNNLPVELW